MPRRGKYPPEIQAEGITLFREIQCYPWRIFYRVAGEDVWVLAVLDGRRNIAQLLPERLVRQLSCQYMPRAYFFGTHGQRSVLTSTGLGGQIAQQGEGRFESLAIGHGLAQKVADVIVHDNGQIDFRI